MCTNCLELQALSALACQKLLLIALEQQNWYTAALFALILCEITPEEAAAGLAIALLGAWHTKTGSQIMPAATPQQAQHVQDSPLFAELAEPSWYQLQQHGSSSTDAAGQQVISRKSVVRIVTHLYAKVQCTRNYIVTKVHCNVKVHCMPSYNALQGTFACQCTSHFKVYCMPDYVVFQEHFKVHYMPSHIVFQGTLHAKL